VDDFNKHVEAAIGLLGPTTIAGIKGLKFDELIRIHHNVGRKIRNGLSLWKTDLKGVHPDEYSMKIMEEIWRREIN
jgi:hypothetical protein